MMMMMFKPSHSAVLLTLLTVPFHSPLLTGRFAAVHGFSAVVSRPSAVAAVPPLAKVQEKDANVITSLDGVDVELPDIDELFTTLHQVSPLARQAMSTASSSETATVADLPWKSVFQSKQQLGVHQIDKIDNYKGRKNAPLLRFRATLPGPCLPHAFANFIMDLEERQRWDTQIDSVQQCLTFDHTSCSIAPGTPRQLGVGHCVTTAGLGISPREQLTLCGIQELPAAASTTAGSSYIIWGTELDTTTSHHNRHLLPTTTQRRCTRATSHVFGITLVPSSITTSQHQQSFDVEYVLQLDIGGSLPTWLTTPIVMDSVQRMFRTAHDLFSGADGRLDGLVRQQQQQDDDEQQVQCIQDQLATETVTRTNTSRRLLRLLRGKRVAP